MILNRIYQWACLQPESAAVSWNGELLNYASFWRAIEASRRFFQLQKLPVDTRVIVLVQSILDSWLCVMGLRANGLNTLCVQTITNNSDFLYANVTPIIVVSQVELGFLNLSGNVTARAKIIVVPLSIFSNIKSGLLVHDPNDSPPLGSHILLSSGTTGRFKKVMMNGAVEDKRNVARSKSRSFDRGTIYHAMDFPLYTGIGFKNSSAVWHSGGCVLIDQRPDMYEHFFRYKINKVGLIQKMLIGLLKAKGNSHRLNDELEIFFTGGFFPPSLYRETVTTLTTSIQIQFGSTELGDHVLYSHIDDADSINWLRTSKSRLVEIVDESGIECPLGQEGHIRIRTTEIDCNTYLDDKVESLDNFKEGYFYPGDFAVKRADGRIRILGRTSDVLILQGIKISVAPLEYDIQRLLKVEDVCLFSGIDQEGDEIIAIAIQTEKIPSQEAIQALFSYFSHATKVGYKLFKEFPRSDSGMRKVSRSVLKRELFGFLNINF